MDFFISKVERAKKIIFFFSSYPFLIYIRTKGKESAPLTFSFLILDAFKSLIMKLKGPNRKLIRADF